MGSSKAIQDNRIKFFGAFNREPSVVFEASVFEEKFQVGGSFSLARACIVYSHTVATRLT